MSARADILSRIERAATAAGRDAAEVTLVAVSKQQPWSSIAPVLAEGQTVFGENRVQEAQSRWAPVRADHPELELRLKPVAGLITAFTNASSHAAPPLRD